MSQGRPSTFTDEQKLDIIWYIASRLVEGECLMDVCRDMGLSHWTLRTWREKHPEWNTILDFAWDMGVDAIAHEIIEIADTVEQSETVTIVTDVAGNLIKRTVHVKDDVERSKLRVWSRLQHISRIRARYKNRAKIPGVVRNAEEDRMDVRSITDEELMAIAFESPCQEESDSEPSNLPRP